MSQQLFAVCANFANIRRAGSTGTTPQTQYQNTSQIDGTLRPGAVIRAQVAQTNPAGNRWGVIDNNGVLFPQYQLRTWGQLGTLWREINRNLPTNPRGFVMTGDTNVLRRCIHTPIRGELHRINTNSIHTNSSTAVANNRNGAVINVRQWPGNGPVLGTVNNGHLLVMNGVSCVASNGTTWWQIGMSVNTVQVGGQFSSGTTAQWHSLGWIHGNYFTWRG